MPQIERFLGFAFASADLLAELNPAGRVVAAVGATKALTGISESEVAGKSWQDLIAPADHAMVEAVLISLTDGVRRGPLTVELIPSGRTAHLNVFRLPGSKALSCALSAAPAPPRPECGPDGYQARDGFEAMAEDLLRAAAVIGQELDLALVQAPGLANLLENASEEAAAGIERSLAGALRAEAFGGAPAARLGPEHFALIRSKASSPDLMLSRLSGVVSMAAGEDAVSLDDRVLAVDPSGQTVERSMRALRYAMDTFVEQGAQGAFAESLSEAFNQSLQKTLAKAGALGGMVKEKAFDLVFQPIVNLHTLELEHYETLVRFQSGESPFAMIRMAEELALIEQLDLAIAGQAFQKIHASRGKNLNLAVNISGRSIEDHGFVSELRRITGRHPELIDRMVLEVTESAAIKDLKTANRHIQTLRADGHKVCLDDFGAGASSIAYLQALQVDVVKIDGRYVRDLASDGREAVLVRHLVELCKELGVTTIAEMIETEAVEDAARRAGVDCGQGWLYGRPTAEPQPPASRKSAARRVGSVDSWG